jgi:hypothetical protein
LTAECSPDPKESDQ